MCPLFCGLLLAISLMLLGLACVPLIPSSSFVSDLISHFLPWYPVLAIFILMTGLLTPVSGAVVLAAGLTILVSLAQLAPIGRAEPGGDPEKTLMLLQANMLVSNRDMKPLRALIDEAQPDLIVLQEANSAAGELLKSLIDQYPHQHLSLQDQHSFGMAVASRQPLLDLTEISFTRPNIPVVRFKQKLQARAIDIVAIHPPNPLRDFSGRRDDFAALGNYLAEGRETPRIVTGDFNATPFSPDYTQLARRLALHNARNKHGLSRHYTLGTWPSWLPAFFRLSIDHTLHTPELRVTHYGIPGPIGSDHLPTLAALAWR